MGISSEGSSAAPARLPDGRPAAVPLDCPFDRSSLVALRDEVATQGGQLGLATQGVEQLVLVAYELASNAVRHGGGRGRLRLWRTGDTVFCQVTDEGAGFGDAAKAGREPPPPTAPGGRGLWLVRCVAADLELESGDAGTVATAQFGLE